MTLAVLREDGKDKDRTGSWGSGRRVPGLGQVDSGVLISVASTWSFSPRPWHPPRRRTVLPPMGTSALPPGLPASAVGKGYRPENAQAELNKRHAMRRRAAFSFHFGTSLGLFSCIVPIEHMTIKKKRKQNPRLEWINCGAHLPALSDFHSDANASVKFHELIKH